MVWPPRFKSSSSSNACTTRASQAPLLSLFFPTAVQLQLWEKCSNIWIHPTSKISMLGWCTVHVMVRPVSTMFLTTRITMAAALASRPACKIEHQLTADLVHDLHITMSAKPQKNTREI